MPKPFKIQESIPPLAATYQDVTDDWVLLGGDDTEGAYDSAGWVLQVNTNNALTATYDTSIDYAGLWLQEHTAFVDSIAEIYAVPHIATGMQISDSCIVVTLLSTTAFEDWTQLDLWAGYLNTTYDLNQLMFRKMQAFTTNNLSGHNMMTTDSQTIAGTNAFATDKLYIRKIVYYARTVGAWAPGVDSLAISQSWIQGFGMQDKEPDHERFYRMQRNVRLFS